VTTDRITSTHVHDGWTVEPVGGSLVPPAVRDRGPVPARVPGTVHTDLLAAGLLADPYLGTNEKLQEWVGSTSWRYATEFEAPSTAAARADLVFEGLDTVATVRVNGEVILESRNQHRSYRVPVEGRLRPGTNHVEVQFAAPVPEADRASLELEYRPHVNHHPYNAIRKMAAGYGWDWGPDLAGVGILGSLAIESWSTVRLAAVRPLAGVDGTDGTLQVHVDLEWVTSLEDGAQALGRGAQTTASTRVDVDVAGVHGSVQVGLHQDSAVVNVVVPDADLWWPTGYGDPHLSAVFVALTTDDTERGVWSGRVGFRTIALSTAPDDAGTEFVLWVNGQPIYVKGANWIPDDALMSRLTPQTYATSIADAVDAGMNLLRVWGGGIYESEDFYNRCDEVGMLVWQDFLFACAAYSEDEPLYSEVAAEARGAITRLSSHASLALWNGNNENIWGYVDWGWRTSLAGRSWGNGYYTELLPRLVAELDPRTPYSPGSPFSFADYHYPNDPANGTMHIWDVWNRVDYSHYRDYPARFVSEFGFQGPAAWSTLTSVVHDEPLDPFGPQMLIHQKADDGNGKLLRGLGDHLPVWASEPVAQMDDWHWLTSLNQARAVAYGIAHFRSHYPLNRGAVVWQLNDNWPVISWAAVDGHGIRKPLWHALKAVYAARLLTVQPRTDDRGVEVPTLVAHNDSADPWEGELVITRRSTAVGSPVLAEQRLAFHVDARGAVSSALDADLLTVGDARAEFLQVQAPGAADAFWFFAEDPELALAPVAQAVTVSAQRTGDGYRVRVTALALVKDLTLFPDRLDPAARVDTGLVTLVAGGEHTFLVASGDLDEVALTGAPVLRSVNDLIAR